MTKPLLVLDFDGCLHSYNSGWCGPRTIPDPPVPGALEFLVTALDYFTVAIYSSRSHHIGGRRAMKRWLVQHLVAEAGDDPLTAPQWWTQRIVRQYFADPWWDEIRWAEKYVVKEIQWPLFKPPAKVAIDDRCMTFTGVWPTMEELESFEPWNKAAIRGKILADT